MSLGKLIDNSLIFRLFFSGFALIGFAFVVMMTLIASWPFLYSISVTNRLENKLIREIEAVCENQDECIVKIRELTNFYWDEMYVGGEDFERGAWREVIGSERVLNNARIVFLKERKVVAQSRVKVNEDLVPVNEIYFINSEDQYPYIPATAIFSVKYVDGGYLLSPVAGE